MGKIADLFSNVWRDYVVPGLPASGENNPSKSQIRAIGSDIEAALSSSGSAIVRYGTTGARDADATRPDGTLAYVYNNNGSNTDPANGFYQYVNGAWVAAPWYFQAAGAAVLDQLTPYTVTPVDGANGPTNYTATVPDFRDGQLVEFRPLTNSVGAAKLNGLSIVHADGGTALKTGDLKAGRVYGLIGRGGGFTWQITSYGDIRERVLPILPEFTVAGGTPNALVIATPSGFNVPVAGYRLAFVTGAAANTGPVTLALNGGAAQPVLKTANAQLEEGDFPAFANIELIWDGLGGNKWSVLTPVGAAGGGGSGEDPSYAALASRRDAHPQGVSTYAAGVKVTDPTVLPVVGTGTSVGRGADLTPLNYPNREVFNLANAPMMYLVNAMAGVLGHGAYSVPFDNQAVSQSFDDSFVNQLAASGFNPKSIVPIIAGMNSASMFGVHAIGADYEIARVRELLRAVKAGGGLNILVNTLHAHPTRTPDQTGSLANGIAWPADQKTLAFFGLWSFDAASQTLTSIPDGNVPTGAFASGAQGGTKVKAGTKLLVQSDGTPGSNGGRTLTVVQRLSDTAVKVTAGDITQTIANTPAFIRHVNPPVEEIMTVPPSAQVQVRDWTGSGVPVQGLASYSLYNKMLNELAREEDVLLVDCEYRGFRYAEKYGWDAIYTATYNGATQTNSNHPVLAAQRVIYGQPLAAIGTEIARGTLKGGYQVYRGEPIL